MKIGTVYLERNQRQSKMFSEENSFVKDLKTSFIIAVTITMHNIVFTLKLIDRFYRLNAATSYRYVMRKFCSEDFLNTSALCQHQQRTVKFKGPFKEHFVGYSNTDSRISNKYSYLETLKFLQY